VAASIESMRSAAAAKGIASGVLARTTEEVIARRAQGFHMIAIGADVNLMLASIRRINEALANG
jgi:2-keto-3-deoxy-L-rhamnonate aldolase RhmA